MLVQQGDLGLFLYKKKGELCDLWLLYCCFPCLGRKESDTHDKRVVEFGKCHVVQAASRCVYSRANTTRDVVL